MKTRIRNILMQIGGLSAVRKNALVDIFILFISLQGRINFLTMGRHGRYSEKTYRTHLEEPFDFFQFNKQLAKQFCSPHRIIAGDCSFIPKSGKKTPHLGRFWSGCASKALPGLEISSLAVVDIDANTALHLECEQTPSDFGVNESRIDFYVNQVVKHATDLKELADYFVYDGAAGNKKFADGIAEHTELELISKLRSDADMRYLYTGLQKSGRGRHKKYNGKIYWKNLDTSRFDTCHEDAEIIIHTAIVNSISLKRNVRVAYVQQKATGRYTILFSTDVSTDGFLIYKYYKARFQIEFLFRDAKQHTGLTHCQARSENKLNFHFNTSLTSVSLAKTEFYADTKKEKAPFSMKNVTSLYFNKLFVDRIFSKLKIDQSSEKYASVYQDLLKTGTIAT